MLKPHTPNLPSFDLMTHSATLRLVVAMEAALADGRYEEAAKTRDEYRKVAAAQVQDSATKAT